MMCKTFGESVQSTLTLKTVCYMVLLAAVPDIKTAVMDVVAVLKTWIAHVFACVTNGEMWWAVAQWLVRLRNKLCSLFRKPRDTTRPVAAEPSSPSSRTVEFCMDFKDNAFLLDAFLKWTLAQSSGTRIVLDSISVESRDVHSRKCHVEHFRGTLPSGIEYKTDDVVKLEYTVGKDSVAKLKTASTFAAAVAEEKMAKRLKLTLTSKPDTQSCLADVLDSRVLAAILQSSAYTSWRKNLLKARAKSSYSMIRNPMTTDFQGGSFRTIARGLSVDVNSDGFFCTIVDLYMAMYMMDARNFDVRSGTLCLFLNEHEGMIFFAGRVHELYPASYYATDIMDVQVVMDELQRLQHCDMLSVWRSALKSKHFVETTSSSAETSTTRLSFTLSTTDPDVDMEAAFADGVLAVATSGCVDDHDAANTNVTVYSMDIKRDIEEHTKPNPDFDLYERQIEALKALQDPASPDGNAAVVAELAKLRVPPKDIVTETPTCFVECTQENVLTKPFHTLYLRDDDLRRLRSVLTTFRDSKELYGNLGLLLHGDPGTGKSTTILSVATFLQCDIYYVSVANVRTNKEFKMLMDHVATKASRGGMVVMEDIDAQGTIFHTRRHGGLDDTGNVLDVLHRGDDALDLSYVLNMFDGTLARDDIVLALTTNHLELIDPAVYRPGRIDAVVHMRRCDHFQMQAIYRTILKRDIPEELLRDLPEDAFTPADLIFHVVQFVFQPDASDEDILRRFLAFG